MLVRLSVCISVWSVCGPACSPASLSVVLFAHLSNTESSSACMSILAYQLAAVFISACLSVCLPVCPYFRQPPAANSPVCIMSDIHECQSVSFYIHICRYISIWLDFSAHFWPRPADFSLVSVNFLTIWIEFNVAIYVSPPPCIVYVRACSPHPCHGWRYVQLPPFLLLLLYI